MLPIGIGTPPGGGSGGTVTHSHDNLIHLDRLGVSAGGKLTVDGVEMTQNSWQAPVATVGDLPAVGNTTGDTRLVLADSTVHAWDGAAWNQIATTTGVQTIVADSGHVMVNAADPLNPRFDLSASAKAVLNHPNMATLQKLGEAAGGRLTLNGVEVTHDHTNKVHLDRFGVSASGKLTIDGVEMAQQSWKTPVATVGDLPTAGNADGDTRVVLADDSVHMWDTPTASWTEIRLAGVQTISTGSSHLTVTSTDPLNPVVDLSQADKTTLASVAPLEAQAHTHSNQAVLADLSDSAGSLAYKGIPITGGGGGGAPSTVVAAKVRRNNSQTVNDSVTAVIIFDTEVIDTTGTMVDLVATSDRITIQEAGLYRIEGRLLATEPSTKIAVGLRIVYLQLNEITPYMVEKRQRNGDTVNLMHDVELGTIIHLVPGDYIRMAYLQTSGGPSDVTSATPGRSTSLTVTKIG